jgi:hypothetical protein
MPRSAPYEKSKFSHSGGSMVARLKLKEIDGRAPQGVNCSNSAPSNDLTYKMWILLLGWLISPRIIGVYSYTIHLYCGDTLMRQIPSRP